MLQRALVLFPIIQGKYERVSKTSLKTKLQKKYLVHKANSKGEEMLHHAEGNTKIFL